MKSEIRKQENTKSNHKLIGILVIAVTLTALLLPPTIVYVNNKKNSNETTLNNIDLQTQTSQADCLNEAYANYEKSWKAADKDSDEKVSYSDGATDITTAYYDKAISCYQTHKTHDSDSYITDYQAKRQQENDKYTAWLQSSKQPTYAPTYSNNYRSSINCRSSSIGSSTYTTCD